MVVLHWTQLNPFSGDHDTSLAALMTVTSTGSLGHMMVSLTLRAMMGLFILMVMLLLAGQPSFFIVAVNVWVFGVVMITDLQSLQLTPSSGVHSISSASEVIVTGTGAFAPVSYTHLRAHETVLDLVCRLLLEKKKI